MNNYSPACPVPLSYCYLKFGSLRVNTDVESESRVELPLTFVELSEAAMSEDDAPARKEQDPAEVWGALDDNTRERVIEIFVDMAFRVVRNQLQSSREGLLPEDGNEAALYTFKAK
jgi:hypothetical protein